MKIHSNRILNFAVLTAVVVVLSPREVLAQDRFERVAPASLAWTSHHPGGKYFATREEAFAAHAAAVANIEGVFSEVVSNLRPCPDGPLPAPRGQWGYINEVPHDWCHDVTRYQITPQGLVFLYSDITTAVKAMWACPDGDGWIAEYRPPIFGPNRPYHARHVCERRARLQAQCPQSSCNALGNPRWAILFSPRMGQSDRLKSIMSCRLARSRLLATFTVKPEGFSTHTKPQHGEPRISRNSPSFHPTRVSHAMRGDIASSTTNCRITSTSLTAFPITQRMPLTARFSYG